jgi:hypothetical protein
MHCSRTVDSAVPHSTYFNPAEEVTSSRSARTRDGMITALADSQQPWPCCALADKS